MVWALVPEMIVAPVPGKKLPPVLESAPLASSVPLPRETVPLERVKLAFAVRRPGPVRLKLPPETVTFPVQAIAPAPQLSVPPDRVVVPVTLSVPEATSTAPADWL